MSHTALIKIGQMADLTNIPQALEDINLFTDEELYDAFFVTNQWEAYRNWRTSHK